MKPSIHVTHDPAADAVWIRLGSGPYGETNELDDRRRLDVTAGGDPIAVELLDVSDGVDLSGLPHADAIETRLRRLNVPVIQLTIRP